MLDRLVKDIVTEDQGFIDMKAFIPKLQEVIFSTNVHVRQFVVAWISTLDSVESYNFRSYLPLILQGLFKILSDPVRIFCRPIMTQKSP